MVDRLVHPEKAISPILVTEAGMVMEVIEAQSSNRDAGISVMEGMSKPGRSAHP